MTRRRSAVPKKRREAMREQVGRADPTITLRQVAPEPRRVPEMVRGDSPITDKQRVLLTDLRRQSGVPRHGVALLTRREARDEIEALIAERKKKKHRRW